MDRAGLENMLMNYYRNINRDKIQFDFLTHRPDRGAYDEEIEMLGGKVYHAPRLYPQNYPMYFKWMKNFFEEHSEYKIVHSHIDTMSYFPLLAAKKAGIPNRIAHSHSSKLEKDLKLPIKFMALKLIPNVANHFCACGEVAGKFMFQKREFTVIRNAIDVKKFSFNNDIRNNKRKELRLKDAFVVGHVGRYCYIKNQLFLLDVFSEIKKDRQNAHLLLIGKGEDEKKIRNKIKQLHLEESVSLLIDRDDIDQLYQVMDVFVMPSLFEGLPVVSIEAQANGLPCIVSSNISREVKISKNIKMLDLKAGVNSWKNEIIATTTRRNPNAIDELERKGYNIAIEGKKLEEFYKTLL
ncbi:glycosyltransferase family 1 protein [Lachnoclostridium sp. An196]|uniref:glycosyltransferase family 1 protein n=1 Tax=Lachnoclostridium sp. An196 TaxID=1965583 RepID=UPI003FA558CA